MDNIHNFTNRAMCEYASIFPTVASVLDHLLFTVGNGYNIYAGLPAESGSHFTIDCAPTMDDLAWIKLLDHCKEKERKWQLLSHGDDVGYLETCDADLAEKYKKYRRISVSETDFSEDALYNDLQKMKISSEDEFGVGCFFVRPYPLSISYSHIYKLDKDTPKWFIQIAINLCNAWVRFLSESLDSGYVDSKPGWDDAERTTRHRDMLIKRVEELSLIHA